MPAPAVAINDPMITHSGCGTASSAMTSFAKALSPNLSRMNMSSKLAAKKMAPTKSYENNNKIKWTQILISDSEIFVQTKDERVVAAIVPRGIDCEASFRLPDLFDPAMIPTTISSCLY